MRMSEWEIASIFIFHFSFFIFQFLHFGQGAPEVPGMNNLGSVLEMTISSLDEK